MSYRKHDPRIHALPYPRNLMLAIAKADFTNSTTPIVEVDGQLEDFVLTQLDNVLTEKERRIIRERYEDHISLTDIGWHLACTSENIRLIHNHALHKLLKEYLKVNVPKDEPADELPAKPEWLNIQPQEKYIKPAKNSIKKSKGGRPRVKSVIPYKLYIRSDGVLYLEIKDEINQHYIGELYTYSNSNFSIEGIVTDISLAGILLTDWEVTRK